ncbi:hypothetical protein D3C80_1236530 [compost metagenome]
MDGLVGEVGLQVLQLQDFGDQIGGFFDGLAADAQGVGRAGEVEAGGDHGVLQELFQFLGAVVAGEDGDGRAADIGADDHGFLQLHGGPFDEVLQGSVVEFDALVGAGGCCEQRGGEGEREWGCPVHGRVL